MKNNKKKLKEEHLKRKHHIAFTLNDMELAAFEKYCKKYNVTNRANFVRETLISYVLKKFDEDYPRLFDLEEIEKRNHAILFSESELQAFNNYCKQNRIQDKDELFRQMIVTNILTRFDERQKELFGPTNNNNEDENNENE